MSEYKLTREEIAFAIVQYVQRRESIKIASQIDLHLDDDGGTLVVDGAEIVRPSFGKKD